MKRLIQFYFRHRKLCLIIVSVMVITTVIVIPHVAFAADTTDPETTKLLNQINVLFNELIKLSSAWIWPILLMIGSLLDNDLVFGGAMGERLLAVWVQVRNLVNIIFVLILLAIAIYNVLGLGEEGGSLPLAFKTVMPKFVLALIAVNFSFLAVKVVLDFTNVITGAVFALPTTAVSQSVDIKDTFRQVVCGTNSDEMPLKPGYCKDGDLNDRAKQFFSRLDRSNITLAYAVRFGRAPQLKFIRDGIKGIGQLGFNIIFNAVLYVAYAASFIALFLVLLFRLVAVWIAVVLSPLLALGIVLPNLKELAGGAGELQQKFVKSAIAPITIGLVLSVGYIMLDGFEADKSIHGSLLASNTMDSLDPNALPTDINDLQQLMIAIGVVVIVWTGVFGAAKDTIAGGVTEFMNTNIKAFGTWAAKLPSYLQVIPTSKKFRDKYGDITPAGLLRTIQQTPGQFTSKYGRSIYEPPSPSSAELAPWQKAARETIRGDWNLIADALKQSPRPLNTTEVKNNLYDALVKVGAAKDRKEAETIFGDNSRTIADNLFAKAPILASKTGYANAAALIEAVENSGKTAAPATKVTDATSAKDALQNDKGRDAKALANEPEFKKAGITPQFIEDYRSLEPSIQNNFDIKYDAARGQVEISAGDKKDIAGLALLKKDLQRAAAPLSNLDSRLKAIGKSAARQALYDQLKGTANKAVMVDPVWASNGIRTTP